VNGNILTKKIEDFFVFIFYHQGFLVLEYFQVTDVKHVQWPYFINLRVTFTFLLRAPFLVELIVKLFAH
jgi:hypothetical protein